MDRRVEIFCPKCKWEPRQEDQWICRPGCSCVWNTFDTCGVCPDCGKVYEWTQCLACQEALAAPRMVSSLWAGSGDGKEVKVGTA